MGSRGQDSSRIKQQSQSLQELPCFSVYGD
jgi:hypothetical protein